jgi:hypothetical protein
MTDEATIGDCRTMGLGPELFRPHLGPRCPSVDSEGRVPDVTVLTRISDPGMQSLLEEVWQPFWARLSDADSSRRRAGRLGWN